MSQTHSRPVAGGLGVWSTKRLWCLADGLPVSQVRIDAIAEFDQDCWFGDRHRPTCRAVAEHARKIAASDLTWPIILASDGGLMDGGHRLAKAWLAGREVIDAVQFDIDPPPDRIIADGRGGAGDLTTPATRPGTSRKSSPFRVTSVARWTSACAAIIRSGTLRRE